MKLPVNYCQVITTDRMINRRFHYDFRKKTLCKHACMCVCVCMCIYLYTCVCVSTCIRICLYESMHVSACM